MRDDQISDVIAHATIVVQRRSDAGPFPRALVRVAELVRDHLDVLERYRNGAATTVELYRIEHRLRSAIYAGPTEEMAIAPARGPLSRAWNWLWNGWS